jgi:hypothetical protein
MLKIFGSVSSKKLVEGARLNAAPDDAPQSGQKKAKDSVAQTAPGKGFTKPKPSFNPLLTPAQAAPSPSPSPAAAPARRDSRPLASHKLQEIVEQSLVRDTQVFLRLGERALVVWVVWVEVRRPARNRTGAVTPVAEG